MTTTIEPKMTAPEWLNLDAIIDTDTRDAIAALTAYFDEEFRGHAIRFAKRFAEVADAFGAALGRHDDIHYGDSEIEPGVGDLIEQATGMAQLRDNGYWLMNLLQAAVDTAHPVESMEKFLADD